LNAALKSDSLRLWSNVARERPKEENRSQIRIMSEKSSRRRASPDENQNALCKYHLMASRGSLIDNRFRPRIFNGRSCGIFRSGLTPVHGRQPPFAPTRPLFTCSVPLCPSGHNDVTHLGSVPQIKRETLAPGRPCADVCKQIARISGRNPSSELATRANSRPEEATK
jgi:hypothetical protein